MSIIYIYIEVVYLKLKICIILLGVNNGVYGGIGYTPVPLPTRPKAESWGRATPRRRPGADAPLAPIPECDGQHTNQQGIGIDLQKTKIPAELF